MDYSPKNKYPGVHADIKELQNKWGVESKYLMQNSK